MIVQIKEPISGPTGIWCQLPYPNHPKGCPNFGKKDGCPPLTPRWNELIKHPYYLVYQKFDLEAQEKRMFSKHPDWSKRQARCLLYWQKKIFNLVLREAKELQRIMLFHEGEHLKIITNPEGAGVDMFKTCSLAGIELERDYLNQKYIYKMVLVGKQNPRI